MAVLIWLGGQGSVYEPSCPCILCPPLSPSLPNAWVMAYLCTIIRRTHTNTHSKKKKKSHQNKDTQNRRTHTARSHIDTAAVIIHRRWSWVRRRGRGEKKKKGKRKYFISEVAASEGPACVTNSAKPSIQLMAGWVFSAHALRDLSAIYFRLHRWAISIITSCLVFCFFFCLICCCPLLSLVDPILQGQLNLSASNKTTHNTQ